MSESITERNEARAFSRIPEFLEVYRDNPRGTPETWGPVPMVRSRMVHFQQLAVDAKIEKLFDKKNIPPYINPQLAEYIYSLHLARVQHRLNRNHESFTFRGNFDYDVPTHLLEVNQAAQEGSASPAELLFVREWWEMGSVELGSLSHPYGQRMDPDLDNMRDAVDDAIRKHGGVLFNEKIISSDEEKQARFQKSLTHYEIKAADADVYGGKLEALHITRKRRIGELQDRSLVVERSSFVVRLAALPTSLRSMIRSAYASEGLVGVQKMDTQGQLEEIIAYALDHDDFETAVPISTTVIARNQLDENAYMNKDAQFKRNNLLVRIETGEEAPHQHSMYL